MENNIKIPSHVGIIMDGNGRWATLRGKKRTYGHRAGSDNVDVIASYAFNIGVKTLTLYAFSCENWARPQEEVDELMRLLKIYFTKFIKKIIKNKIRLFVSGDITKLTPELQDIIHQSMSKSEQFTEHTLNIAINYGGKQEIVHAVNQLISEKKEITVDNISSKLWRFHPY